MSSWVLRICWTSHSIIIGSIYVFSALVAVVLHDGGLFLVKHHQLAPSLYTKLNGGMSSFTVLVICRLIFSALVSSQQRANRANKWHDAGQPVFSLCCFLLLLWTHAVEHLTNISMQVQHHIHPSLLSTNLIDNTYANFCMQPFHHISIHLFFFFFLMGANGKLIWVSWSQKPQSLHPTKVSWDLTITILMLNLEAVFLCR